MADPAVNELLVESTSFLFSLVARLIVSIRIELLSAISTRHHMDNGIVAAIAQVNRVPAGLIKQSLPHIVLRVGLAIHNTSITHENAARLRVARNLNEDIFESHLGAHNVDLKPDSVLQTELVSLDHSTTFHE